MSVTIMRKLSAVALRRDGADLMRALQKMRCVDVTVTELPPATEEARNPAVLYDGGIGALEKWDVSAELSDVRQRLRDTHEAAEYLARYEMKKKGLFHPAEEVNLDLFLAEKAEDARAAVTAALALRDREASLRRARDDAKAEAISLLPWLDYRLPLPGTETSATVTVAGILPGAADMAALTDRLEGKPAVLTEVSLTETGQAVSLTVLKAEADDCLRILTGFGFTRAAVTVGEADGFAAGRYAALTERISSLEAELDGPLRREAEESSLHLPLIRTLEDAYLTDEARITASSNLRTSRSSVILTGWIPAKAEGDVAKVLEEKGAAWEITDPAEGEEPPILLSNNQFASKFEPVLSMYALPKYGTFDPTAIMSVFYVLIFGLMFADAGYGLLLSLGAYLFIRLTKPTGTMKSFIMMFGICGLSCAVMGVLFGSYFGNLPSSVAGLFGKGNPLPALLFDPMEGQGPMYFLILSLGVGAVHLMTGLAVKMVLLWKQGHRFAAVADVGSWLLIFLGLILYALLSMVLGVSGTAGLIVAGVGAATVVLTAGREAKNPVMKLLKGLLGLYDIVSYASDLLSYSRILSLCLASAVIANVVNLLGTLPGPGFGSVIGLMIAFLLGHTLNMALNLLGTFVHTSRLQYIEFFGKFYEDGGRAYRPLVPESRYVQFR